jgi:hypothetical protein
MAPGENVWGLMKALVPVWLVLGWFCCYLTLVQVLAVQVLVGMVLLLALVRFLIGLEVLHK